MSKAKNLKVYSKRNSYTDRAKEDKDKFQQLPVEISTIDTALLLLDSEEEEILRAVFRHITLFIRKTDENIAVLKEKNVLELLLKRELYGSNTSEIVRRFASYIATAILENSNMLQDFESEKTCQILDLCLERYLAESDYFCIEYMSVIINKCFDDPQAALRTLGNEEYLAKSFRLIATTDNPDVLWNSIEALYKMLQVQENTAMQTFTANPGFPIDRLICDLTNEFLEIRTAVLKVLKLLIVDTSETSPFAATSNIVALLQQLTKLFCDKMKEENLDEVIEVLARAMRSERIAQIFFEYNLFDKLIQHINETSANDEIYALDVKCRILAIFAETAKYEQYLHRLHSARVTDWLLNCLLQKDVKTSTHVVMGLNRLMKYTPAANRIVDGYPDGLLPKLLEIISMDSCIKTREEAAELLRNLLTHAYHNTASELIQLKFPAILAHIFGQGLPELSIDFVLTLLSIIEQLAQNADYRSELAVEQTLTQNIALMLKDSFSAAIIVTNIFRCLCTLIDEEEVRTELLLNYIIPSVKRGLKSLSNVVKTAVTNFIMQTARFNEFVDEYINNDVLEILILHQKHAFCVSTWKPAIESILSKCPSLKFAIRNHLGFTDSIRCGDFYISKYKFDDFRDFQKLLLLDCSPKYPIYLVNFCRPVADPDEVITVPRECFLNDENCRDSYSWCYSKHPADEDLPRYLDALNRQLELNDLVEDPAKVGRSIDFDNIAKRAKIIAELVGLIMSEDLKSIDLNSDEECPKMVVKCHLKELAEKLHCTIVPLGMLRSGCEFERAVLFKALADQIGLPCTLQRSVDGRILFNEIPIPLEIEHDVHCDKKTMKFMPWRMLRPTHIVDLMYNVGDLYPLQSRQALQYLRLY